MKTIYPNLLILLVLILAVPQFGAAQDSSMDELNFEVNRVYPPISIAKEKLKKATTLLDLNRHYKSTWVRTYLSVEVAASYQGDLKTIISENDTLSQEQKELLNRADEGSNIAVKVRYLPENTLKQNDSKEIKFKFTVEPESEAAYVGGEQKLRQYLKENAIDEIPEGSFQNYDLAIIKFMINEEGAVVDAHIFEPLHRQSKDEKIDKFLLETICNMPKWQPAAYTSGKKVKQEFALTVGNHKSCVINLVNINREGLAMERY